MTILTYTIYMDRQRFFNSNNPGNIFALNTATINKSYLENFDLEQLQAEYPDKVEILGDMVRMKGPVYIVPKVHQSAEIIKQAFKIGLFAAGTLFFANSHLGMTPHLFDADNDKILGLAMLASGAVVHFISKIQPNKEGIQFYEWSRNWPFMVSVKPLRS